MARVRRTLQIAEPLPADPLWIEFAQLSMLASASDADSDSDSDDSTPELTPAASPEPESPTTSDGEDEPQPETAEDPRTRVAAEHVFAIGDAADAFGAVNAGHNAFFQGEVAARNILKLVKRESGGCTEDIVLDKYAPGAPAIKVTLGLVSSVSLSCPLE